VPFVWVEFKVGQMGIFVIEREDLMTWHIEISALAAEREAS
jgi:ribosomal protein L3 glutamine methyltransferase